MTHWLSKMKFIHCIEKNVSKFVSNTYDSIIIAVGHDNFKLMGLILLNHYVRKIM